MTIHLIPLVMLIGAVVTGVYCIQHTGEERHNVCPVAKLVLGIYVRHQLRTGLITFRHIGYCRREIYL